MSNHTDFHARTDAALANDQLQAAMAKARVGFVAKRQKAVDAVPNFDALREKAKEVRERSLKDIDIYLAYFEKQVTAAGGHVHWARTTDDMRRIVLQICKDSHARTVTKGKSMVAEEVELNAALLTNHIEPMETDLGEYIIQLAHEKPSHIIAPALHKSRQQIIDLFQQHHELGERQLDSIQSLVDEARQVIRQRYLDADVGITGANMLVAETGSAVLVTNEGNGDLTASLPNTHIVTTSFDKVVPTMEDAAAILRVLARSATGQPISTYTSFYSPKSACDKDGPEHFHVVILDNGRSELLGSDYETMLHCIKCGACMNHCPVYQSVGGHAYNSVYPGPMGSVLTPLLRGDKEDLTLPHASTFCGRCESVCPVGIPLPGLLRKLRDRDIARFDGAGHATRLIRLFGKLSQHPTLYRYCFNLAGSLLAWLAPQPFFKKIFMRSGWLKHRTLPPPEGGSFQQQWRKQQRHQK